MLFRAGQSELYFGRGSEVVLVADSDETSTAEGRELEVVSVGLRSSIVAGGELGRKSDGDRPKKDINCIWTLMLPLPAAPPADLPAPLRGQLQRQRQCR